MSTSSTEARRRDREDAKAPDVLETNIGNGGNERPGSRMETAAPEKYSPVVVVPSLPPLVSRKVRETVWRGEFANTDAKVY